ncbi:MAG: hypothetical protein IPP79_13265 [Chitinophagaceae bacterium]|nr:hypothetical protein [Chitinophagaceae bacterium]
MGKKNSNRTSRSPEILNCKLFFRKLQLIIEADTQEAITSICQTGAFNGGGVRLGNGRWEDN